MTRNRLLGVMAVAVIMLAGLIALGNKGDNGTPETNEEHDIPQQTAEESEPAEDHEEPTGNRTFRMALTPFPYNITTEAVSDTYLIIGEHTDMVAHHFDSGVPWVEAYSGDQYHDNVMGGLYQRLLYLRNDQAVYLALTPLNGDRSGMAGYWAEQGNGPREGEWADISFDDPLVVDAYLSFCDYMIGLFDPIYFAYGIEANMLATHDPDAFEDYLLFLGEVYPSLKEKYPDLPIFLTFQMELFNSYPETQGQALTRLLPYTDIIAVSSYPFTRYPDPSEIPSDYYGAFCELAPDKPFAVAETGFPSDHILIEEIYLNLTGNMEWQREYTDYLLENAESLEAEFIVWFVPVDYDGTWEYFMEVGVESIYKMWIDTGLFDENVEPKPALSSWDEWLKKRVGD